MAESFFATLKAEIADAQLWRSRVAARTAIFAWIEVGYNRRRSHAARGYHAPVADEEQRVLLQDRAASRSCGRGNGRTSRLASPRSTPLRVMNRPPYGGTITYRWRIGGPTPQ
jgi:hypothetical protein